MYLSSSSLIAGVLAAAALGSTAFAQEPAATQPPAAPAAEVQPPAAPAAEAAAPATPAAPAEAQVAAAPPPPPPVLPTTGDGAVIVDVLNKICRPLVEGKGAFDQLAKGAGLTMNRRTQLWTKPLTAKTPFAIEMSAPSVANKNVCSVTVKYAPGYDQPIVDAMNVWRFLHDPQLHLQRNEIGNFSTIQRTTTTWDNWENQVIDGKMIGLILVQLNAPDGKPVNPNFDEALIQYSQRAATAAEGVAPAASAAASPAG